MPSQENGEIVLVQYKYFHNLIEMPVNTIILLIGVARSPFRYHQNIVLGEME